MPLNPLVRTCFADDRLVSYDLGAAGRIPEIWEPFAPHLSIYAFDARPGSVQHPLAKSGLDFHKIEAAIGGTVESGRSFYITKRATGSSFLQLDPHWISRFTPSSYAAFVEEEKLDVRTLSHVIDNGEAPKPEFMKLDIQGAELETLQGLRPEHRGDLVGLVSEVEFVPVYKDQPLFEDVHELMGEYGLTLFDMRTHRGYIPHDDTGFGWYKTFTRFDRPSPRLSARIISGDALYFRDYIDRPPETPNTVRKLALAFLIHNYFDQAWTMVDMAEKNTVLEKADAAQIKQAIIASVPRSSIFLGRSIPSKVLDKIRHLIGLGPKRHAGWSRQKWPSQ